MRKNSFLNAYLTYSLYIVLLLFVNPFTLATTTHKKTAKYDALNAVYQDPLYPERTYRTMTLKNKLRVLLISDPTSQKAAASLIVNTGAMSDPKDAPGLAHFLEHMLFLGTKKYPKINGFQDFLSQHGGASNAYTAALHTNYFFSVNPKAFQSALNRYAQFFIAPLFSKEYMKREINAVNSEHEKNIPNDARRIQQIMQIAYAANHPARHFATGNSQTLAKVTRKQLIEFYQNHYSSNLMHLVIIGNQNLNQLQQWVNDDFSSLNNRHLKPLSLPETFLPSSDLFRLLEIKTVANIRQLKLIFPLPPSWQDYQSNPLNFISFLFGHEGKGSLLSRLKSRGLANGLSAGVAISNHFYSAFGLTIDLTEKGAQQYKKIISEVFDYKKLLDKSSLPKAIFNELNTMETLNFRYAAKQTAERLAIGMNEAMRFYPVKKVIHGTLITSYNPTLFKKRLDQISPNNMLVILAHPHIQGTQKEPFYGINYTYQTMKLNAMNDWQKPKGDLQLSLPQPNPFIPKKHKIQVKTSPFVLDLASIYQLRQTLPKAFPSDAGVLLKKIRHTQDHVFKNWQAFKQKISVAENKKLLKTVILNSARAKPSMLINNDKAKIFYRHDPRFKAPKATVMLRIETPTVYATAKDSVLSELYVNAIDESFNEYRYMAEMAGLSFSIHKDKKGIMLIFSGYSNKLLFFANTLTHRLKTLKLSQNTYLRLKDNLQRRYDNFAYSPPYQQGFYYAMASMEPHRFMIDDYKRLLPELKLDDLLAYCAHLYDKTHLQGIISGDIDPNKAKAFIKSLNTYLNSNSYSKAQRFHAKMIFLPKGHSFTYLRSTPTNNASSLIIYPIGVATPKKQSLMAIFTQIIEQQFYTELRTRQQLGYIVSTNHATTNRLLMQYFVVQSANTTPHILNEKITAFIDNFGLILKTLTQAQLKTLKNARINQLIQRPSTLNRQAKALFKSVFDHKKPFNQQALYLKATLAVTKADLIDVYQENFKHKPRRIIINLYAQSQSMPKTAQRHAIDTLKKHYPCAKYCLG